MPYTLKATINGQAQDVEVAEIPEAVFTAEARTRKYVPGEAFESELSRRAEGIVKNKGYRLPDELVEDQDFVTKVSTKHGLKKADAMNADEAQRFAQRLEGERKSWENKDLTPVKTENEAYKTRIQKLVDQGLQKEILRSAAAVGLKKSLLKDMPGRKPLAAAMFDGVFGYDPESDNYYVRDGQGFAFSPKATKDHPYMTIEEYLEQWAGEKDNADYVEPNRQTGPGLNKGREDGGGTTRQGEIILTPEQASNAQEFQEALKKVNGDYSKIRVIAPQGTNPFGSF